MGYNKKEWQARTGTGLNKFRVGDLGIKELVSTPDEITQQGDAISATNLNAWEDRIASGILDAYKFSFVIDSQDKMDAWVNNTAGNDYSTVAIIGGSTLAEQYIIKSGINLTERGTVFVKGFNRVNLRMTATYPITGYLFQQTEGIFANAIYKIEDIKITFEGASMTGITAFFYQITGMKNVVITGDHSASTASRTICRNCYFVENCKVLITGTGRVRGFYQCYHLRDCIAQIDRGAGFRECKILDACAGCTYFIDTATGYVFDTCIAMTHCYILDGNAGVKYNSCYANFAGTSAYAVADTDAGGFNTTTAMPL